MNFLQIDKLFYKKERTFFNIIIQLISFNFMTTSLANFLGSLFWGSFLVVLPITAAVIIVSRLDPISREEV
jgi:photosystem II PsbX protein